MIRWAIKWGPYPTNPRARGYVDERTISSTRRGAWQHFAANESPTASDHWRAEVKRKRRAGHIRAVRVEIKEITP